MKNIIMISIIITLILIMHINAYSTNININGKFINFTKDTGYPFIDENNRVLVPLNITMKATGAHVYFDSNNQIIKIVTNHTNLLVPIGKNYILKNGEKIETDIKAMIENTKIYFPIRTVLELIDFSVEWCNKTQTVFASDYYFNFNNWIFYNTGIYH